MTIQIDDTAVEPEEEEVAAEPRVYTVHALFRTDNPDLLELILGSVGAVMPTMVEYGVDVDLKVE